MASKIILKKSSVASKVPLVGDLDYGELALNYTDGKLYYKTATNTISSISGSGTSSATTWIRKTANYTAVSGDKIIADTSGGVFTVTLPSTPAVGNYVEFTDGADWGTNSLTVARNGSTVEGTTNDVLLNVKGISVYFIYDGTTWQVTATLGKKGDAGAGTTVLTQNSQSANYTLISSDSGKYILHPSTDTTPRTFTIPSNASVPFSTGTSVTFINQSTASATVGINTDSLVLAGTGPVASVVLPQYGLASALKVENTTWYVSGFGLTYNSLALTDPSFSSVSLLLHLDGSSGGTTFTDSSSNNVSMTGNNGAQLDTSVYKFGTASGIFSVGAFINTTNSALFAFGSGSFTVEAWIYRTGTSNNQAVISTRTGAQYSPFELILDAATVSILVSNAAITAWQSIDSFGGVSVPLNTWTHLAFVGNGTNLSLYVNGTKSTTVLAQPAWSNTTSTLYFGKGGNGNYQGNIDEIRVTKGVARYTANFTAPTQPFPNS